jgi:cell division protease FtsH
VHKITIVPRGRALGVTASLPEEDRHSYSRDYLIASLAMLYGGRAAEEMIFGPEKITTGAGNDIERATALARRMVTQFGMSDRSDPWPSATASTRSSSAARSGSAQSSPRTSPSAWTPR